MIVQVRYTNIKWDTEGQELPECGLHETETISVNTDEVDLNNPADAEDALMDHFGFLMFTCDYEVLA